MKNGTKPAPRLRILVIDDDDWVIKRVNKDSNLSKDERVLAKKCTSLEEAVGEIGRLRPTHIFLDHFLGKDAAGLEIAEAFKKKAVIVSTTGSQDLVEVYAQLQIEHCPKNQIPTRIRELIQEAELASADE